MVPGLWLYLPRILNSVTFTLPRPGAGYDKVDVDYLTKNGAYWANSPNSVGQRTADSTAMLILMALRGTSEQERSMRAGNGWI